MSTYVDDAAQKEVSLLMEFLNNLPGEERKSVTNSLVKLRERLSDVISNTNPISPFLIQIKQLRVSFLRIPLFLRKKLKSILVDGLEASMDNSSVSLSIFTICLCLMEFSALRNSDHSDLEATNISDTIVELNSRIIPGLTTRVLDQRTNLPSLLSWSLCMLVFTFRACSEWLVVQNCSIAPESNIFLSKPILKHSSVPLLMRIAVKAQSKRRPFFIPCYPHSTLDMLFANATTNNTGHLSSSRLTTKYDPSQCPLESDEPIIRTAKMTNCSSPASDQTKQVTSLPDSFQQSLENGSAEEVYSNLKLLHRLALEISDISKVPRLLDNFVLALQFTPLLLRRLKSFCTPTKSNKDTTQLKTIEESYCLLLGLWIYAVEQRILMKFMSQSYVWLAAFANPDFEFMTLNCFVQIVHWTARLLTVYQSRFRSAILASPHWYLQIITDIVIEIINRSEKFCPNQESDDQLEEVLSTCVISISRPFNSLHADEPDIRHELSRAIKTPMESIIARMATCRSVSAPNSEGSLQQPLQNRPTILPKIRELILNHLLFPMLNTIDPWALGQARLGLRPPAARALLKQILTNMADSEISWDGVQVSSKLELPKTIPAVGGLHIADKLSLKRKR